ncbi:MAG: polysaccharide deacetylase family protein [Desulfuromonadales bacterium]
MLRFLYSGVLVILLLLANPAFADQANVFVYHRFNDSRYPSTNISTADFRAHLDLLSQEKFSVLTLGQVIERLQQGTDLPQRCAVITIDDAYRSFLTEGWPLLKEYGYPATLFVSTDAVGGGGFLSWQELKVLQAEGVEIGNHSAGHVYFLDRYISETNTDWSKRVSEDLFRSRQAFENNLGSSPKLFAYPYGEFAPELINLVKEAGFTAAFGQQSGVVDAGQDPFSLPRFPAGGQYAAVAEFRSKLFMKRLSVRIVSPASPVIKEENPPRLRFYLHQDVDSGSLRCFVPGSSDCLVRKVSGEEELYEAESLQPLSGRRSKYTLTARDARGKSWYWFSQLWIQPRGGEVTDYPVSR